LAFPTENRELEMRLVANLSDSPLHDLTRRGPTKQTEIGELPERWQVVSIAEKFDTQLGKMLSVKARQGKNPKLYVRNANVQWGRVNIKDLFQMDFTEPEQQKFRLRRGDLLVCEGGEIGRTAIWLEELPECYFQKAIHRLRPKSNDILPQFFQYWMERCFRLANLYKMQGARTTIAHLPQDKLEQLKIPLPSIDEQSTIVRVLDSVQRAKQARQRELILERERKAALMEYLFTRGTCGEPSKRTKNGEIPESWTVLRLEDVAVIERGKFAHRPRNAPEFYGGSTPFIQTGDVANSDGHIRTYSQTLNERGLSISRMFPRGTIVITIAANIGFTGILDFDSAFPDSLIGITPKETILARYLNYYLVTQRPEMDRKASRGTQKNINIEFLKPWPVVVPPLEEQATISGVLQGCDAKIEYLERETLLLEEIFRAMLEELMSGRLLASSLIGERQAG
jgi:type I restriction enzyme S subunit